MKKIKISRVLFAVFASLLFAGVSFTNFASADNAALILNFNPTLATYSSSSFNYTGVSMQLLLPGANTVSGGSNVIMSITSDTGAKSYGGSYKNGTCNGSGVSKPSTTNTSFCLSVTQSGNYIVYATISYTDAAGVAQVFGGSIQLSVDMTNGTATLYIPPTYSVTFNSNNGSAIEAQTVIGGNFATMPADPTLNGYVFAGWYLDNGIFAKPFDFEQMSITSDTTLFANWLPVVPPEPAVTNIGYSTTNPTNQSVTVTLTANMPINLPNDWARVDDTTYTKTYTENTAETVDFTNQAGDSGSVDIEITNIDTAPPYLDITGADGTSVTGVVDDPTVTITVSVASQTYTVMPADLINVGNEQYVWNVILNPTLANGNYTVFATATDTAGNETPTNLAFNVSDTVATNNLSDNSDSSVSFTSSILTPPLASTIAMTNDSFAISQATANNSKTSSSPTATTANSDPTNAKPDNNSHITSTPTAQHWALLDAIFVSLTVLISVVLLLAWLGQDREADNHHGLTRLLTLVLAIGAVIVFFTTENWHAVMSIAGRWSWLIVVILIIQIILAITATRHEQIREQ